MQRDRIANGVSLRPKSLSIARTTLVTTPIAFSAIVNTLPPMAAWIAFEVITEHHKIEDVVIALTLIGTQVLTIFFLGGNMPGGVEESLVSSILGNEEVSGNWTEHRLGDRA